MVGVPGLSEEAVMVEARVETRSFVVYPLKSLYALPSNVRSKKKRTPEDVLGMAHSINAYGGLIQNLAVVPEFKNGRRTGRAGVAAGETRRLALCLLRDGGVPGATGITDDFPVHCREVDDAEAVFTSAVENIARTPMHPADQFVAFNTLFEQCGSVEHVAAVFNTTALTVSRRLRLANAAPCLLEEFRDDRMTLEQLMALCITEDHAEQVKVWNAAGSGAYNNRAPQRLRQMLLSQDVAATAPLARFVGVAAYEKAGGVVRRDLFADDDAGYLTNSTLLQSLAQDKLAKAATKVQGWAWVETRAEVIQSHDLSAFGRAQQAMRELSDAERDALAAARGQLESASKELDALYERADAAEADDEDLTGLLRTSRAKHADLQKALSEQERRYLAWPDEVRAHAGVLVAFDQAGKLAVHFGLIRPQDRKAAAKAVTQRAPEAGAAAAAGSAGSGAADTPAGAGPSEALSRRLTAHRTAALQRVLAGNTQVALAALAHSLVQRVLQDKAGFQMHTALDLQAKTCDLQMSAATEASIEASRAWTELKALRDQWGDRIPGDPSRLLPWLIALPMTELCDLLALCIALTVNAVTTSPTHASDALATAVGLDMAEWWEPTGPEYLSRVPKAGIAQALADAGLSDDANSVDKLKKGEAVAKAEASLAGKRWLPALLRRPANA